MIHIYALFYVETGTPVEKRYFYVGRSIDVPRRVKQHLSAARLGHEDKYAFMRGLEKRGIAWHHDILRSIPDGEYPPDNERWAVIDLTRKGHRLTNMRHGSVEHREELARQVLSPNIRSVADVRDQRLGRPLEQAKYTASKRLRRRVLRDALRREGIPDVRIDTVLPPLIRRRLIEQECFSVQAGVSIAEVVSGIRRHRIIRRIRAKVEVYQRSLDPAWTWSRPWLDRRSP